MYPCGAFQRSTVVSVSPEVVSEVENCRCRFHRLSQICSTVGAGAILFKEDKMRRGSRSSGRRSPRNQRNLPKEEFLAYRFPHLHTFGFSGIRGRHTQMACLDSRTVVYAIGCGLFRNRNRSAVPVATPEESVERIVAVVASSAGHVVATCELTKSNPNSQVSVFDMRICRKVGTFVSRANTDIEICAFSKDERFLMTASNQSGGGSLICCWDIKHSEEIFSTQFVHSVTRITINPKDDEEFATSGPTHFKLWSRKDGAKKDFVVEGLHGDQGENVTFSDHIWLVDNNIAVATLDDVIFIVREGTVQLRLHKTGRCLTLASTSRGFIAAGADGTITRFTGFEFVKLKVLEKAVDPYVEVAGLQMASGFGPITTILVAHKAESVVFFVEGENVVRLNMDASDEPIVGSEIGKPGLSVFTLGAVMDMDLCLQRMLIVSCGSDNYVRLWSYVRLTCEKSWRYDTTPVSVAICCFQLIVAFPQSIRVYRLMADTQLLLEEIAILGVCHVRFSPSGHLASVATDKNIIIFCSFTWKSLTVLKGHKASISTVVWSHDSIHLASADVDGFIYSWFMDGFYGYARSQAFMGSYYTSILYDPSQLWMYVCGPNTPLRVLDTDKKVASRQVLPEMFSNSDFSGAVGKEYISLDVSERAGTSLADNLYQPSIIFETKSRGVTHVVAFFGRSLLVAATNTGQILLYSLPFTKEKLWEHSVNAGTINGLVVDEKNGLLMMASAQGSISLFSIESSVVQRTRSSIEPPTQCAAPPFNELDLVNIVLMRRTQIEESKLVAEDLRVKLELEHEDILQQEQLNEQRRALALKRKDEEHVKAEKELYDKAQLSEKRIQMAESDKETTLQSLMNALALNMKEMRNYYEDKMQQELTRSNIVQTQAQRERNAMERLMKKKQDDFFDKLEAIHAQLQTVEEEAHLKMQEVEEKCNRDVDRYKQYYDMDLQMNDEQLEIVSNRLTDGLARERRRSERAHEQLACEKKVVTWFQAQVNKLETEEKENSTSLQELQEENENLKKLVLEVDYQRAYAKQLLVETDEKTQSLMMHHKENQTVSLIRNFKIAQLQTKRAPMEAEVLELQKLLKKMEQFQEGHENDMKMAKRTEKMLQCKVKVQESQMNVMYEKFEKLDSYMNLVATTLCRIVEEHSEAQHPKLIKELYMIYARQLFNKMKSEGFETEEQILHQRQTLERFVVVLEESILRRNNEHKREEARYHMENMRLLHELSESQQSVLSLAVTVKDLQGSVSYFKALAAKHRSATSSTLTRMSETLIKSDPSPTLQRRRRRSKSQTGKHSLILSKETSPSICVKFDPDPELLEKIREDTRSTTPLSEIIKPYLHRGSIARHVSMRHSLIQPISATDKIEKPKGGPDISEVLSQKQDEVKQKDKEIADLQTHILSLLAAPYLHPSGPTSPASLDIPTSATSVTRLGAV